MTREILNGKIMDCRKQGLSKYAVKHMKRKEGIRTEEVKNRNGE